MKVIKAFLFLLIIFPVAFAVTPHDKISPSLHLLLSLRENQQPQFIEKGFPVGEDKVAIIVRFDHRLIPDEISDFELDGCDFTKIQNKIFDSANCYGMKVDWNLPDILSRRNDVLQITSSWKPKTVPCLDLSNPEVQAELTWTLEDLTGLPVTGHGVKIADFDTGIDVFHPAFFRMSSDTLDWIDVNTDNEFSPGIDAVDLNANNIADPEEILGFIDGCIRDDAETFGGPGGISNADSVYQPEWDWLYNDADNSGEREYGFWNGFTESDPTYGELLFISLDTNENSILDIGEKLIPLGESKIYATMNSDEIVRWRGVDLIYSDPDYGGHGTAVSGILAGGQRGIQRFTGIAPDADLIMGYHFYGVSFETYLPWVREQGCKTLLYEFGSWVYHPLDGSEIEELLIDVEAISGVIQVLPSGNLNRGEKHSQVVIAPDTEVEVNFTVEPYSGIDPAIGFMTLLWREYENDMEVTLTTPDGQSSVLNGNGSLQTIGQYDVYSERTNSLRMTAEYDLFWVSDDILGDWTLSIRNEGNTSAEINCYISDEVSSWEGGAEFTNYLSNMKTVTFPATADSAFVLGSYSTRGYEQYIGVGSGSIETGQLSKFSGRGPRIDGVSVLSVISPGNYDVYSARYEGDYPFTFGGWRQFSGTSAAGPHVAGACALLWQGLPQLTQYEIGHTLETNTFQDSYSGFTYNDSCGYGKIRIYDALSSMGVIDPEYQEQPKEFSLDVFPNPFNSDARIEFYLPVSGISKVKLYDIMGRESLILTDDWMPAGKNTVQFSAENLASGIYFLSVKSGEYSSVKKIIFLK